MNGNGRSKRIPSPALIFWGSLWLGLAGAAAGDVYVAGSSSNGANNDYFTLKYDPDGLQLWSQHYSGTGNDAPAALAVD